MPDAKEVLAVLIVIGCFALFGGYLLQGGHLDTGTGVALSVFCTSPLSIVIGFYFGKANGVQTGLATSALQLAQSAIQQSAQRRTGDPATVTAPVTVLAPQPGPASQ